MVRVFGVPGVVAGGAHTGRMALIDPPPELRRLAAFMAGLPKCPYGCHPSRVYETPSFRVPAVGDTIDDQVSEFIERLGPEVNERLRRHLAEDQEHVQKLGDFFAFLDEARRDAREREAAYRAWMDGRIPEIAEELTETLPADLRPPGSGSNGRRSGEPNHP